LAAIKDAGNCLLLAILTKAYTSLVGIKVEYRKVNSAPVYSRESDIMAMSSHVQAHVCALLNLIIGSQRSSFQQLLSIISHHQEAALGVLLKTLILYLCIIII
jgi:hypothetical protein